jgi:hypothetical protein
LFSQSVAAVVWEDNFDDDDLDGWTEHEMLDKTDWLFDFIAENDACYADCPDYSNGWTWLSHPSSQSEGQWSFDYFQPAGKEGPSDIIVMANGTMHDFDGYGVSIATTSTDCYVSIAKYHGDFDLSDVKTNLDIYVHGAEIQGSWIQFDATCESGDMNVFMDGELILQYSGIEYDNSSMFIFSVGGQRVTGSDYDGFGMDNVVVDDEITMTPTPLTDPTPTDTTATNGGTTPPPPMDTTLLIAGAGAAVVVIMVAIVFLKKR